MGNNETFSYEQLETVQAWLKTQREALLQEARSLEAHNPNSSFLPAYLAHLSYFDSMIAKAGDQKRAEMQRVIKSE